MKFLQTTKHVLRSKIYQSVYLLLFPLATNAQNTLDEYIQIGLQNNSKLIQEQLSTALSEEKASEVKGNFLPDIMLNASYTWADGGRSIDVPAGNLVNPAYRGLNQLLGENRYPTNIQNTSEQLLPNNFHETKIRLIQPVLDTDLYYSYLAKRSQVSQQQAQKMAYKNQLVKEIKSAYYQYLSARDQLQILTTTKELLEDIIELNRRLVANNKATREIIYDARAQKSNNDSNIARAKKNLNTAHVYFNFLIGRSLDVPVVEDSAKVLLPESIPELDNIQTHAQTNRMELSQIQYGIEANHAILTLNQKYFIPKVSLIGDIGYQGFEYKFNATQEFWLLRIGLTWPIFQGFQNASRINQSKIKEEILTAQYHALKRKIAMQVTEAYYEYKEAHEILTAKREERQNAQETYRISFRKYKEGLTLPIELNRARTNYTNAQLGETIARYNVKIKKAVLEAAANLNL